MRSVSDSCCTFADQQPQQQRAIASALMQNATWKAGKFELVDRAIEAGAIWFTYAIESADSEIQTLVRKNLRLDKAQRIIAYTQRQTACCRPVKYSATWVGVNTRFGGGVALDDPQFDFSVAETVQKRALDTKAGVVVFPELLVRRWGEGADLFWQPTFDEMRARGIAF
jgi:hypothetical protein